jgi:hypothetical protein
MIFTSLFIFLFYSGYLYFTPKDFNINEEKYNKEKVVILIFSINIILFLLYFFFYLYKKNKFL